MNQPFEFRDRFEGPARHQRIGPTVLDDLRDLWAEINASRGSHALVGLVGLMGGAFGTVGLAWIYGAFFL